METGIVVQGFIRGKGVNPKTEKPFIQLEINNNGMAQLYKVTVKSNGQKIGDKYNHPVALNLYEGKFYGFREI